MRKTLIAFVFGLYAVPALAQDPAVVNMLKAPTSPVAQLLNFAPTVIEKPTDLASLWLSLKNSSSDLGKLPNCYALDWSPEEVFKGQDQPLLSLRETNFPQVAKQTFLFSIGLKQFTDSMTNKSFYKTGFGVKLSLFRPDWDSATTGVAFNKLKGIQDSLTDIQMTITVAARSDAAVIKFQHQKDSLKDLGQLGSPAYAKVAAAYDSAFAAAYVRIAATKDADLRARIKTAASAFVINRRGWSLDLAGGFSASFPNNTLGYSLADKSGLWLTGGYNTPRIALLGIVRYLYQPDSIFADTSGKIPTTKVSTLDGGASFNYNSADKKFNLSLEAVYRGVLGSSVVTPSWHVVFSASYSLADSKMLCLNFGRDFNGQMETGGNLVAGINLILGFGGAKKLPSAGR
jgi:hypothetical protein